MIHPRSHSAYPYKSRVIFAGSFTMRTTKALRLLMYSIISSALLSPLGHSPLPLCLFTVTQAAAQGADPNDYADGLNPDGEEEEGHGEEEDEGEGWDGGADGGGGFDGGSGGEGWEGGADGGGGCGGGGCGGGGGGSGGGGQGGELGEAAKNMAIGALLGQLLSGGGGGGGNDNQQQPTPFAIPTLAIPTPEPTPVPTAVATVASTPTTMIDSF